MGSHTNEPWFSHGLLYRVLAAVGCALFGGICVHVTDRYMQEDKLFEHHHGTAALRTIGSNHKYSDTFVRKTVRSDKARFLFVAGLGGTGHHGWRSVFQHSQVCKTPPELDKALRDLWYGQDRNADDHATVLRKTMMEFADKGTGTGGAPKIHCLNTLLGSMLSYPDKNNKLHHPNILTLAKVAESAGVDLRLVLIHRHPANQLVSLSMNRNFLPIDKEAHQMSNQAAFLNAELELLDPDFYMCAPFDQVNAKREEIQEFVQGGTTTTLIRHFEKRNSTLSYAIHENYSDRPDNSEAALDKILALQEGKKISIKIEEMNLYYDKLKDDLCRRKRHTTKAE